MRRFWTAAVLGPALISGVFAAIELLRLRSGNYQVPWSQGGALLALHMGAGVAIGLACWLATLLVGRRLSPRLRELAALLPSSAVLFLFSALAVNVLWLPSLRDPVSLVTTGAILAACVALAWALSARRRPRPVLPTLAGLLAASCVLAPLVAAWPSSGDRPASAPVRAEAGVGTLVVILVDTLRPDHLGTYGYGAATSPTLDRLAREGVVFDAAYSSSNWTRPAVASLFTSTMPSRHGAVEVNRRISPDAPLLADSLAAQRYSVGFFTSGANVEAADGYGRNVDRFVSAKSRPPVFTTLFMKHLFLPLDRLGPGLSTRWLSADQVDPAAVTSAALEWLESVPSGRPAFVYLHYHGPHTPYAPPADLALLFSDRPPDPRLAEHPPNWGGPDALSEADRRQTVAQYDAEILWHDREIDRLLSGLRELGRLDDAALFVVADHGEAFGEHGAWAHGQSLFDEVTRIPLIAWSPRHFQPGRHDVPVSLLDVAPTVLDLARAPIPASFDGGSLRAWLEGADPPTESRVVFFENSKHGELGVRTGEWVYFRGETPDGSREWLYAASDRLQEHDLIDSHPEVAGQLRQLATSRQEMDASRSFGSEELVLDEARVEQLKALGYLQ